MYKFRGLPISIRPEDELWYVSGEYTYPESGDKTYGILEWCYDEEDAIEIKRLMYQCNGFKDLSVGKYTEENEQENINKETEDNFMLITTQAISLLKGYSDFLDEEYNNMWLLNPNRLCNLSSQIRTHYKIINFCTLQILHLKYTAKLHHEFAESYKQLKELK